MTTIDLSGQVAVVTGPSGNLGPVWCDALLGAGAHVVGLDLAPAPDPALAAVLERHDRDRYTAVAADVTDRAGLDAALAACVRDVGPPSIVVNNAGVDRPPSRDGGSWRFGDIPDEVSATVLAVNAHGTLRVCQVFGSAMAGLGRGSVINIGSMYGGVAPDPRLYEHLPLDPPFLKPPAYGMSKAGVSALSRYLAALWGPAGVRVNTLSPGGVLGGQDASFRKKFGARVPLRRLADPADLAGPLLFLASDLSRYVTGTELVVDGGYTCW
jgi:NAD(P)-dependent dehydrogenase (short-subunit alcohol dehydrogenase family)